LERSLFGRSGKSVAQKPGTEHGEEGKGEKLLPTVPGELGHDQDAFQSEEGRRWKAAGLEPGGFQPLSKKTLEV